MVTGQTSNSSQPGGSALLRTIKEASRTSSVIGFILVPLGLLSMLAPTFSGIAVTLLVGCLLALSGAIQAYFAIKARTWRFLIGLPALIAGIFMIAAPDIGLQTLTIVLVIFFLVTGISHIVLAFKMRSSDGWLWLLFDGVIALILGIFIIAEWPVSGLWAVGIMVGIRLILQGWAFMAMGTIGKEVVKNLEDFRTDEMQHHIQALTLALQETQLLVASQSVAIVTLDNEIRKKVSSEDVDPLIKDLNQKVGEAREIMTTTAQATQESWQKKQAEAAEAFEKLKKSTEAITSRFNKG